MEPKDFWSRANEISDKYRNGVITILEARGMIDCLCMDWNEARGIRTINEGLMIGSHCGTCDKCSDTGVIETGNNDLPCSCSAGDFAMFNVAGRGKVQGWILKKERW